MEFFEPIIIDRDVGSVGFRRFCGAVERTVNRMDHNIRARGYWRVPQRAWCTEPEWIPDPRGGMWAMVVRASVDDDKDSPE